MYEYLQIGKIVNIQGIKGEVRVIPLTDNPGRFEKLDWLYIEKNGINDKYYLEGVKYLKNLVILKLKGVDNPETAEALRGSFLLIDRINAVKLAENSFFICDLIGMKVVDEKGKFLGKLDNILQTGSNDVYVVKSENGGEILLPALKSVVREISIAEGRMHVIVPKGLLDDEI
ncbi:MAG: 16S rRNA processing protein RimM [Ruminiclostridium sp.]|nr:16S rRNA processing protein RimM [Ruminiclostridium sp.]